LASRNKDKKEKKTSLRKKIIQIVLLSAAIPILIFFLVNSRMIFRYYRDLLYNNQKEMVEMGSQRISLFITTAQDVLLTKTETVSFEKAEADRIKFNLNKAIKRFEYLLSIGVYDKEGNLKFYIGKEKGYTEEDGETSERPQLDTIAPEILTLFNVEDKYTSNIYYDKFNLPRMSIYVPIKDSNNERIGVLSGEIDLNYIYKIIKGLSTKKQSIAYMVDGKGRILIHPGKAKLREDFDWASIPPVKMIIDGTWDAPDVRFPIYTNVDGLRVVGIPSHINKTRWGLVLERQESDVFGEIHKFFWISLAVSMLILLFCLLFAYRYIRLLLSPFDKLYEGAEAITEGNLEYRIDLHTHDELQEFGDSFNRMSSSLELQRKKQTGTMEELKKKKKELEVSNLQLKEASRLKSEFLANMSHELRTPMNTIIGYTSIIIDGIYGELTPKQENSLKKIYQNARNLSHLIDDILDLSKIDAGKMPVFKERFFISRVVKELMVLYEPAMKEKGLELKLNFKDDIEIETDRSKVKQVLDHIINNAVKFTQEGSITISSEKTKQDDYLKVSVADTGIGIEPDSLERIFEEFRQLDGSFTREFGGTGLGLSIVKKILNIVGSKITVSSQVGEGSVFSIYIPLIQGEKASMPSLTLEREEDTDTNEMEDVTKKIILVIDDEPDVLEMMRDIVRRTDYRVVGASSGKEGIELAKKIRPYLIITDIFMPDKNGWEIIKELKSNPITLDIPIFVISISDERAKGYAMGVTEYFVKPIERDLFLKRLAILSRLRAKKILIVDDDYSFLENFFRIVREQGFQIISCDNGKDGLEKFKVEKPDVLILDIMMPRFSGLDMLDVIEQECLNVEIPVIIMTAKELTQKEHERLSKRVITIIKKTGITREELLPRLRSVFERIWCGDVPPPGVSI